MNDIEKTYDSLEEEYLNIAKTYFGVDESSMDEAIRRHSSVYAFFGSVLAYAQRRQAEIGTKLEMGEAKHMELRRSDLLSQGSKATQGTLNAYVLTVQELIDLRDKHLEAQHRYNLAKNLITSLDHQKDMLVQMSANKRAEVRLHEL